MALIDADVILLHRRQIRPESVATFRAAGYPVTTQQAVLLQDKSVDPNDALALRQAGYDFTLEELIKLRRWDVPAAFAVALMSDGFDPLTSDQLVELHLRRVTVEMVEAVRGRRGKPHEVLATPAAEQPEDFTQPPPSAPARPAAATPRRVPVEVIVPPVPASDSPTEAPRVTVEADAEVAPDDAEPRPVPAARPRQPALLDSELELLERALENPSSR